MTTPKLIILISGKRKCGKDYLAEALRNKIGDSHCQIVRISEPIKSHYAKENNLNLEELLSETAYKEKYRLEMIKWSDEIRKSDSGYFCKAACDKAAVKPVWIVSDIRRQTDINWFTNTFDKLVHTVRISADIQTRIDRGWVFTSGVDDVTSECDLDEYTLWDLKLNNNNQEEFEHCLESILRIISAHI